jgi:hypothetical protein
MDRAKMKKDKGKEVEMEKIRETGKEEREKKKEVKEGKKKEGKEKMKKGKEKGNQEVSKKNDKEEKKKEQEETKIEKEAIKENQEKQNSTLTMTLLQPLVDQVRGTLASRPLSAALLRREPGAGGNGAHLRLGSGLKGVRAPTARSPCSLPGTRDRHRRSPGSREGSSGPCPVHLAPAQTACQRRSGSKGAWIYPECI